MKHLIELRDLSNDQIFSILERAAFHRNNNFISYKNLENYFVVNLFLEPSTRTRFSFEVAAKRLGAQVLNFAENTSSRVKGESMYDTIKTLEMMGVHAAVVRTSENYLLHELQSRVNLSLINAGAGSREHPTQALLDIQTMLEVFGKMEGLTVGIVGDIAHSRVAGSHMHVLPRLGARLLLSGPPGEVERKDDPIPANVEVKSIDDIIKEADVVMMLRIQHERHGKSMNLSMEDYHQLYGLTIERASRMRKGAIIMHPAPINRGVEIDSDLVEAKNSVIFKQVTNGVFTRMAVLETVMGGVLVG